MTTTACSASSARPGSAPPAGRSRARWRSSCAPTPPARRSRQPTSGSGAPPPGRSGRCCTRRASPWSAYADRRAVSGTASSTRSAARLRRRGARGAPGGRRHRRAADRPQPGRPRRSGRPRRRRGAGRRGRRRAARRRRQRSRGCGRHLVGLLGQRQRRASPRAARPSPARTAFAWSAPTRRACWPTAPASTRPSSTTCPRWRPRRRVPVGGHGLRAARPRPRRRARGAGLRLPRRQGRRVEQRPPRGLDGRRVGRGRRALPRVVRQRAKFARTARRFAEQKPLLAVVGGRSRARQDPSPPRPSVSASTRCSTRRG